jgi:DNA-binding transcriptional ArsR family regulator
MGVEGGAEAAAAPAEGAPKNLEDAILQALGDPVSRVLLAQLMERPCTPQELREASGAPQSTVYRKIAQLESWGLVGLLRSVIRPDGHRVDHFRSRVLDVRIHQSSGRFVVEFRRHDLSSERLGALWRSVRGEREP